MQHIEDAKQFELPRGVYIEFEQFEPLRLTEDEQASQRERGADLSEENRLYRDRVHEANGERIRYRLWYQGPDRWRMCRDNLMRSDGTAYHDAASNADGAWLMSPGRLHLIGPEGTPRDNKSVSASFFLRAIRMIVHQMATGVHPSPRIEYTPLQTTEGGDGTMTCVAEVSSKRIESMTFTLEPHGSGSDGYDIRRVRMNPKEPRDPAKPARGSMKTFDDWRWSDAFGARIAHAFTVYSHDIPYRIHTVVSIRPIEGSIDDLIHPPEAPAGTDPIRGEMFITDVMDHKANTASSYDSDSGALLGTSAIRASRGSGVDITPYAVAVLASAAVIVGCIVMKMRRA